MCAEMAAAEFTCQGHPHRTATSDQDINPVRHTTFGHVVNSLHTAAKAATRVPACRPPEKMLTPSGRLLALSLHAGKARLLLDGFQRASRRLFQQQFRHLVRMGHDAVMASGEFPEAPIGS